MKKTEIPKRTESTDKDYIFDRISSHTPESCANLKKQQTKPVTGRDRHEYERKKRIRVPNTDVTFGYQKVAPRAHGSVFLGHKLDTVEPKFDVYEFDATLTSFADAAGSITCTSEKLVAAVDHIQKAIDLLKDDSTPLERRKRKRLSLSRFKQDKTETDLILSFEEASDLAMGKIAVAVNTLSQAGAILRNTLIKRSTRT